MWQKHKTYWSQKSFISSVCVGVLLLIVAFSMNQYANAYITTRGGNSVTDIILDNIPVVDVHLIFSEGAILFVCILIAILMYEPKYIPFVLKSIAVFILIRSFFLTLTHLSAPAGAIYIDPNDYVSRVSSGNDLFFSGHVGFPFLLALIFWHQKLLRFFFFACSLIGGVAVLLGHLHYSIDVFSALFISFGIFHICTRLFVRDFHLATQR